MAAECEGLVAFATIVGGFAAAIAAAVALFAAPVALLQLRQAERLRRLDFYQGLLMQLYTPGTTTDIVLGDGPVKADAEATRLRSESSKLLKAAIVLRTLRGLSADDYGDLFGEIEQDVRSALQAIQQVASTMVASRAAGDALKPRFELIHVICEQALLYLESKRKGTETP